MPLSAPPKVDSNFVKLKKRAGQKAKGALKSAGSRPLEIVLVLFLIANLFVNLKILFALYIIFYFADRWNIMKLFERQVVNIEQPKVVVEQKED